MYYLLENNMILSDKQCNKYINYEDKENDYVTYAGKHGDIFIEMYLSNGCKEIRTISKVIKKSENVFDLIEVGDLFAFKYKYMDTEAIDIAKVVHIYRYKDGDIDIATRGYVHATEKIQAIYKPNSKGDYIKVWEKENEQK